MPASAAPSAGGWQRYANRVLAAEVSAFVRYYDRLIQYARLPNDGGLLLELIDWPAKDDASGDPPDLSGERDRRTAVLLNGNFNHSTDIQALLAAIRSKLGRTSRVVAVLYNPYFAPIYRLANAIGLRTGETPRT